MRLGILHIVILFLLLTFVSQNSYAQANDDVHTDSPLNVGVKPWEPIGGPLKELCTKENKTGHFTGNIVRCVNKIVTNGGDRVLNVYVKFLSTIVYYAVILAILFHGLRMMFGVARNHGITIMLIVKLVVVLYFCSAPGFALLKNARTTLINFPKAISVAIVAPDPLGSPILGVFGGIGIGFIGMFAPNFVMDQAFDKVDTIVCEMIGGGDNSNNAKEEISETKCGGLLNGDLSKIKLFALGAGLFFTGSMGLSLTMIILTYLTATFMVLAQLILYFTVLSIAINFLMALAPLALACMLFEPTVRITKTWFNFLIAYSIQPIVFAAFLALMVTVFSSAKDESKKVYQKVSDNHNGQITFYNCFGKGAKKSDKQRYYNGYVNEYETDEDGNKHISNSYIGKIDACDFKVSKIELDRGVGSVLAGVGAVYKDPDDKLTEADIRNLIAIKLAMIIFMIMMLSILKAVPDMVNKMVGGGSSPMGVLTKGADKLINPNGRSLVEGIGKKGQSLFARR